MGWNPIATDDVMSEFSQAEQSSLSGLGDVAGAAGDVTQILNNVIATVHDACLAGGNVVSIVAGTVPDQLRANVIAIVRWRWLSSSPLLDQFKTKDRESLYNDAMSRLEKVEAGTVRIVGPTDAASLAAAASTTAPANAVQVVVRHHPLITDRSMKGVW